MSARIILASGSAVRAAILSSAGIRFDVEKPQVDEAVTKDRMSAAGASIEEIATALADEKALEVSARTPGFVIGGDQILRFESEAYDKAASMDEARARLSAMRGKPHELVGAAVLARNGEIIARTQEISRLTMREFSDAFLDDYLARAGEAILASVGCYQFENLGAQLFERVEGDYFAILGLPLLPVLAMLREAGALET